MKLSIMAGCTMLSMALFQGCSKPETVAPNSAAQPPGNEQSAAAPAEEVSVELGEAQIKGSNLTVPY